MISMFYIFANPRFQSSQSFACLQLFRNLTQLTAYKVRSPKNKAKIVRHTDGCSNSLNLAHLETSGDIMYPQLENIKIHLLLL
jgi:hypothetical protein